VTETPVDSIRRRVASAAVASGRDPACITVTAVSKTQAWEAVRAVLAQGQRVFGENRVQEAKTRWTERRDGLELRLIGSLQTNKVRDAVALFDAIATLDREDLALAISKEIQRQGRAPQILLQVITGREPQKSGVAPQDLPRLLTVFRSDFGLEVAGLMCIPPANEAPDQHFECLATIARQHGLQELSMGISGDFETAVRLGATRVRVGTAIFGPRSIVASGASVA
jgi:pyridoxal phosphate enzyme (YggS family)